jgi:hypothetical protein
LLDKEIKVAVAIDAKSFATAAFSIMAFYKR